MPIVVPLRTSTRAPVAPLTPEQIYAMQLKEYNDYQNEKSNVSISVDGTKLLSLGKLGCAPGNLNKCDSDLAVGIVFLIISLFFLAAIPMTAGFSFAGVLMFLIIGALYINVYANPGNPPTMPIAPTAAPTSEPTAEPTAVI